MVTAKKSCPVYKSCRHSQSCDQLLMMRCVNWSDSNLECVKCDQGQELFGIPGCFWCAGFLSLGRVGV